MFAPTDNVQSFLQTRPSSSNLNQWLNVSKFSKVMSAYLALMSTLAAYLQRNILR